MSENITAEDQLMIFTYYFMKGHKDCKSVRDARKLIDEGKFVLSHSNADSKVNISDGDVFAIKGRQADGRPTKSYAKVVFEQNDSGLKMQVDKDSSTRAARMSLNYIEHIRQEIDSAKIELKDIEAEVNGENITVTVKQQKDFLEELSKILKEKAQEKVINGKRGKPGRNEENTINIVTNNNIDNSITAINNTTTEADINTLINEIEQIAEHATIVIKGGTLNYNTISAEEIIQNLNDRINVNKIQNKIYKLKSKIETDSSLDAKLVNSIKKQIEKLEKKIIDIKSNISIFDYRITKMINESSTRDDVTTLNNLLLFYKNIIIKCNEKIKKIEEDSSISEDEKKDKVDQLKLIINECESKNTIIRKKIREIEERLKPVETTPPTPGTTNPPTIPTTPPTPPTLPTGTPTVPPAQTGSNEKPNGNSGESSGKKLTLYLDYSKLIISDRYRAKVMAYINKNKKNPNIFTRLMLWLPSKYTEYAREGIEKGDIKLEKVVKDVTKYDKYLTYEENGIAYSAKNGLAMYRVSNTPVAGEPAKKKEENSAERGGR